jgi:hypothetical protein
MYTGKKMAILYHPLTCFQIVKKRKRTLSFTQCLKLAQWRESGMMSWHSHRMAV